MGMNLARVVTVLVLGQAIAGIRIIWKLARTARGERIATSEAPIPGERVTVLVPVLNERARLGPCLTSLLAQPGEVAEILVVDGGSTDGTQDLIEMFATRDDR